MAYASLISLEQATDNILNHDKYYVSAAQRKLITSIRHKVELLLSFLEKYPSKAHRFEGEIGDFARFVEYSIEFYMCNGCHKKGLWFWFERSATGDMFQRQLEGMERKFSSIYRDIRDDQPSDLPAQSSSSGVAATRNNDAVIGLDPDLTLIRARLCGGSSNLEVIPIVGMGGIGKTTLARNAYDHPSIVEHFDIRVFVQVSQDYSEKEFLSTLIASNELFKNQMLLESNESGNADDFYNNSRNAVFKSLKGRRYLIVIDDIWSKNVWDDLRNIFPEDGNGSKIMLTSRLFYVAAYASLGSPIHRMKFMDADQSWNLLKKKVFTDGQDCSTAVENIGKKIAVGCGGLPLAVVLVAGILSTVARTRASWEEIAKDVNSFVDEQLDRILSLSYRHLPHHLRPCFLYIARFPDDHTIKVSMLIKLWVAEGFLEHQSFDQNEEEEEAEKYLEDLVKRSLVLVTARKSNGKIKTCRLHHLVREMCRMTSQKNFIPTMKDETRNSFLRATRGGGIYFCSNYGFYTHTLICFRTGLPSFLDNEGTYHMLRVLDLIIGNDDDQLVIPQIFELIHLKYLAVAFAFDIPSAISNLVNLQTLIIGPRKGEVDHEHPPSSSYLPLEILKLPHLRHLVFADYYMLPDAVDQSTLALQDMKTLSLIASFVCSERIVEMFPSLKKLGLVYFENEGHQPCLCHLALLQKLEKMKIRTIPGFSLEGKINSAFPRALRKLVLDGGRLPWRDMTIVGSLPNLEVLKLVNHACDGDAWETAEEEFPQLKFLKIRETNLKQWITKWDHFPRLKRLEVSHCPNLSEIPDSIGEITTLDQIYVDDLNQNVLNSVRQILRTQREAGNDVIQAYYIRDN